MAEADGGLLSPEVTPPVFVVQGQGVRPVGKGFQQKKISGQEIQVRL